MPSKYPLFAFVLTLFFSSCVEDAPDQGYLTREPLIKLHFNKYQIEDLEKLMAFFETEICGKLPSTSAQAHDCYTRYLQTLAQNNTMGNHQFGFSPSKQDSILNTIRPVTFQAIWSNSISLEKKANSSPFGIKYGGQYHHFLESLAKENKKINSYLNAFNSAGSITPSMTANIIISPNNFDIHTQTGRLLVAIHFLTLARC